MPKATKIPKAVRGDFIETPDVPHKITAKQIIKKENIDMEKEEFKKTKSEHRAEIAKLKQDIKKHKLLIKQARIMYKLSKMKG